MISHYIFSRLQIKCDKTSVVVKCRVHFVRKICMEFCEATFISLFVISVLVRCITINNIFIVLLHY